MSLADRPGLRILAVATQGSGGDDESRLRTLLGRVPAEFFPFDRSAKRRSSWALLKLIRRDRPELVIMEGTGIGGGIALLLGRFLVKVPYVVSSGDAVGPFVRSIRPWLGPLFGLYERWLYRHSAGFIGWSPYLTGRALTFGTPRAMTAAGWAPFAPKTEARSAVRRQLGIAEDALVFGIVGSLVWNRRVGYSYGLELVKAIRGVKRPDVRIVIVGEGDARPHLEALAHESNGRCVLAGRVDRDQVPAYLAAFDVASLPQSLDGVGMFRYTTKISEYLGAGLPIVTGRLPLAYDLDGGWLWRLPGQAPWHSTYIEALAQLMETLSLEELAQKRANVPSYLPEFDRELQVTRTTSFVLDLLNQTSLDQNGP